MPITQSNRQRSNGTPVPFDVTLTTPGTAQTLATVPVNLQGSVVSLINDGPGAVHIGFDHIAVVTDLLLKEGEAYSDGDITVTSQVSFIDVVGTHPRVRGVLWCGG